MARKILLPVLPSDRFYDAVVAAGDILAREDGSITFLFPTVRPSPRRYDDYESQTTSEMDVPPEGPYDATPADLDAWQDDMVAGLDDARALLFERGVSPDQLNYLFADYAEEKIAQGIADEAAAGAFDLVILSHAAFIQLPDIAAEAPRDIAAELAEWKVEGVKLLVT